MIDNGNVERKRWMKVDGFKLSMMWVDLINFVIFVINMKLFIII